MNIKKYIDIKFISIYTLWGGLFGIVSPIITFVFFIVLLPFTDNLTFIQLLESIHFTLTETTFLGDLIDLMPAIIFFGSFLPMFITGMVLSFIKNCLTDINYTAIVFLIGFVVAFLDSTFVFLEMIGNLLKDYEIFSIKVIVLALCWVLYSAIQGIISIIVLRKFILPKS